MSWWHHRSLSGSIISHPILIRLSRIDHTLMEFKPQRRHDISPFNNLCGLLIAYKNNTFLGWEHYNLIIFHSIYQDLVGFKQEPDFPCPTMQNATLPRDVLPWMALVEQFNYATSQPTFAVGTSSMDPICFSI